MNLELKKTLNQVKKDTAKWKFVRNKIGGHLDIEVIQDFCEHKNYKGVFISNEIEADFKGIIILQMIESAVNLTLKKSKLFDKELNLTNPKELNSFIEKMNSDWLSCLKLFNKLFEALYTVGKKEKLRSISRKDIGIIKF